MWPPLQVLTLCADSVVGALVSTRRAAAEAEVIRVRFTLGQR